jgi:acyl-CoA synthetase (AMP-forming)/AMP-acid ligase II
MNTEEPATLWAQWSHWSRRRGEAEAVVHWSAEGAPVRWTWRALLDEAERLASVLERGGIGPGHVCALIVRHHPRFHALYLAVSALGAIPAVLAYPNARLHPDKFVQGLRGMAARSGLDWILTERPLEDVIRPLATGSETTVRGLLFPLDDGPGDLPSSGPRRPLGAGSPGDICLLQHSSGTTGLQKAVTLDHRTVLEHVRCYGRTLGVGAGDRIVSWLPLYHDMGLIAAFHMPLALGIPVVQLDPFEWVSMPELLLQAASSERATLCWLPNFAYNLLVERVHEEELAGLSLSSLRMVINCSEPVRAESHARFMTRFEPFGLPRSALGACYAMAETTFAATQTPPGARAREFLADRAALGEGRAVPATHREAARACVSSGRPIPGCQVQVTAEDGASLPEGAVGELWLRSEHLFAGYRNNPEETARAMAGGWYRSGDLGFVLDGEVFVVGRSKDLIIVAGKNIYPEDVEDGVSGVEGVLPGRVVAWGTYDAAAGTESVSVVAETALTDPASRRKLKGRIQGAGSAMDVTIGHVHLVPPRWLIKSSSGKPSRKANAARIERGEALPPLHGSST